MHIAFFDLYEWEKPYLQESLQEHTLSLFCESISEELLTTIPDVEVISMFIHSSLQKKDIDMLPQLKLVTTRSTGFDHINVEYCKKKDIHVSNVPFYGEHTVAEHTFALILSLSRNVHKSYMRTMHNDYTIDGLIGFDLQGKTLGVLGTGHIGKHVIRIAKGFDMKVLAYDPYPQKELESVVGFSYVSLDELLSAADIVTLHMPYTAQTHHLLDENRMRSMKKGSILINTARGGIVDTKALWKLLEENHLGGVGLDVIEGEHTIMEEGELLQGKNALTEDAVSCARTLIHRENVVFTPHIAFYSREALRRIADTTIENIQEYAQSGLPVHGV